MSIFNIYLSGVGGQGIGMISEIILRAADYSGQRVKSVDTHGLAQRGGIVSSSIRVGDHVYSPLIMEGEADLVIALERHEALRGMRTALKNKGTLIYYNTIWQPIPVRLNMAEEIVETQIEDACKNRKIRLFPIHVPDLEDARMQNVALLSGISKHMLIPEVQEKHYRMAMEDLMAGSILEKNITLFNSLH